MKMSVVRWVFVFTGLVFVVSPEAFAVGSAGFENASHSAKALGRGGAYTAGVDTPSAVTYNPAAMSELDGVQVSGGVAGLSLMTNYYAEPGGVNTRSANKIHYIPNFYSTVKIPKLPVSFGFGMNVPFGLRTQYNSSTPFRYVGYNNKFSATAYTMAGAVKLTPKISVGAGAIYYGADLSQKAKINSTRVTQGTIPGFPDLPDAELGLYAKGSGWGWQLGSLWQVGDRHKLGFNYRSKARLQLDGHVNVENIQGPVMLAVFGSKDFESNIDTDYVLPAQATIAYQYQLLDNLELEVDFAWTGWHVFDQQEFAIENTNPVLQGLTPIPRGFHDTFSFHVGGDWDINSHVSARSGYFFYQTPVRDGNFGPDIPDNHRHGFTIGFGFNYRNLSLDLAYLAELFAMRHIKETSVGDSSGAVVEGRYYTFVHLLAFNLTYRFGLGAQRPADESIATMFRKKK